MNFQKLLAQANHSKPVGVSLIGVGQFGLTFAAQCGRIPGITLNVLCDRDTGKVQRSCLAAGYAADQLVLADSIAAARRAGEAGKVVITDDAGIAVHCAGDVVIEATGHSDAAAHNALLAIEQGKHLIMVTKEADCVIGPLLARRAASAGVVLSQVDGDQPSLTMGLISWARSLGFEIACAGKASEYDFVLDTVQNTLTADFKTVPCAAAAGYWLDAGLNLQQQIEHRAQAAAGLPLRTAPDHCELCLIANGTGLKPDIPELHSLIARTVELPDLFRPREYGGLLGGGNRLDVFNCLRRPDEISFAGGVFVIIKLSDKASGELFAEKGIPVSDCRNFALIYNPTHLLGAEAPLSVLTAARLGFSSGSDHVQPVCDVVMRATGDLADCK
jgi:predicted homoserine dehydrogenase-like protein